MVIISTKLLEQSTSTYMTKVETRKIEEDYMEWEIIHLMAPNETDSARETYTRV